MNTEEYFFESEYWGNCVNTLDEDLKHFLYAEGMSIPRVAPFELSISGKRILDIGGGPSSMLLQVADHGGSKVIDPIEWPSWVTERYKSHNIELVQSTGEDVNEEGWDEVWIYNCLQHTIDPQKIIENAKKAAPVLRIFEWLDIPAHEGHPQELKKELLDKWIGQEGYTTRISLGPFVDYIRSSFLAPVSGTDGALSYHGCFIHRKYKL
jgi:hypothetical protein